MKASSPKHPRLDERLGADALRASVQRLSDWLTEDALPLWGEAGADAERGGFLESLAVGDGTPAADFKRLRVQARQIYVFTEGARLGFAPARGLVERGLHFMLSSMRAPDGGFVARVTRSGEVLDGKRDLYDQAFTLFCLAKAYRLLRAEPLVAEAMSLLAFLRDRMAHPAGGYVEALPPAQPRRQNPHMHLLEAMLAWAELHPDGPWLAEADALIELATTKFITRDGVALIEYFDDGLSPLDDARGRTTEPGHHFEWVWLLAHHSALTGRRSMVAAPLYAFAYLNGIDAALNLPRPEVLTDGAAAGEATRIWTATEWLKAETAMLEMGAGAHHAGRAVLAAQAIASFLDPFDAERWIPGLWRERRRPDGSFIEEPSPASSLYHITLAIAEARRVVGL